MLKRVYSWIDVNKEKDVWYIIFLKFIYSLGSIEVLHSIINTILGLTIPILFSNKHYFWFAILVAVLIFDIIFNYMCLKYRNQKYIQRKFASEILTNHSSLINSIVIEIQSNSQWKNTIFKKISELVCEKIHSIFREVLKCETRVSIEYIFEKEKSGKTEKHIKMSGRRSPNRDTCKKAILLERKSKYYSYKIFKENNEGIHVLSHEDILNPEIWYNNSVHNADVKQYFGVAVSVLNENVDFILQIDCLDDIVIGQNNTDEEIAEFINRYLKAYINITSFSYLLNLNKKKQIPEV